MSDITLSNLETYCDANGMAGAVDAANGTIDLAALTGDAVDGTTGFAEGMLKLLSVSRKVAVAEQVGLTTYGAVTQSIINANETEGTPARVRSSVAFQAASGFSYDDAVAL